MFTVLHGKVGRAASDELLLQLVF